MNDPAALSWSEENQPKGSRLVVKTIRLVPTGERSGTTEMGWEADIKYFDDPREAGSSWPAGRDAAQRYFARYRNQVEFS